MKILWHQKMNFLKNLLLGLGRQGYSVLPVGPPACLSREAGLTPLSCTLGSCDSRECVSCLHSSPNPAAVYNCFQTVKFLRTCHLEVGMKNNVKWELNPEIVARHFLKNVSS